MRTALRSFVRIAATIAVSLVAVAATAQTVLDSPELYSGEKALYEAAKKEGMVVSFDTGPTWANWAAEFTAFKKRYPEVEIVYNDIGSGATVVALVVALPVAVAGALAPVGAVGPLRGVRLARRGLARRRLARLGLAGRRLGLDRRRLDCRRLDRRLRDHRGGLARRGLPRSRVALPGAAAATLGGRSRLRLHGSGLRRLDRRGGRLDRRLGSRAGTRTRRGLGRRATAALPLGNRGDQFALTHPGGAGDAQGRGEALQLGQQHRGQPRAAPAALRGSRGGAGAVSDVRNTRRHVGGVAQWIPSVEKTKSTRVCSLVAGCPRNPLRNCGAGVCSTAARRFPDPSDVDG